MNKTLANHQEQLLRILREAGANASLWQKKQPEILTLLDALLRTEAGLRFLYEHIEEVEKAGLFTGTSWETCNDLVPSLVKGTLCSGFPMVIYESLNEIRMLKLATGEARSGSCSQADARQFLQEAIIAAFDLAFHDGGEETRYELTPNSLRRIQLLFRFLLDRMPLDSFKQKLVQEIREISEHRPIKPDRLEDILKLVREKVALSEEHEHDQTLRFFVDACFHPTVRAQEAESPEAYMAQLDSWPETSWREEARQMAYCMNETGLVSEYHLVLLQAMRDEKASLIPEALGLDAHGQAEFERHREFVSQIIEAYIVQENREVVYGLTQMLNRNLLSRDVVYHGLTKFFRTRIHPDVKRRLKKGKAPGSTITPRQMISGGIIQVLGQPYGIGQGMNPTCQSARGLSMWSRHSPGKLLNMLVGVVASNELRFRYQGEIISSTALVSDQTFDYNLDPVSAVLVPHLDNIYQQMMQRAQIKFPAQDPHVTVNPAFYGLWIPTGFISCYNQVLNVIQSYAHFVKLFYAAFHPEFNRGFRLMYPVPLGIFITSSRGEFLGFHAISLLRVDRSPDGVWRAYFFNPNNDGRQNWGQGIAPTVSGNGELHGESSLPFPELVSRVYAFHYNTFEAESNLERVNAPEELATVTSLAKESWGKKYFWD